MTRGGAGPGQLCWSLMHCLMSVRGGQWAHHGPGHQQSPGGEWSVVWVIVVSIFSIYPYLFTLRRWICLSLYSFPVIRTVSHYLINIACQVTSACWHNLSSDSLHAGFCLWWNICTFDLLPVTASGDVSDLTMSVAAEDASRGCVDPEKPHRGHTRRLSRTSAASIGWADEMFAFIGWDLSWENHEWNHFTCRNSWFSWKTNNPQEKLTFAVCLKLTSPNIWVW